jgi:hypothetical protein
MELKKQVEINRSSFQQTSQNHLPQFDFKFGLIPYHKKSDILANHLIGKYNSLDFQIFGIPKESEFTKNINFKHLFDETSQLPNVVVSQSLMKQNN